MAKRRGRPRNEPTYVEEEPSMGCPPLLASHDSVQQVLSWSAQALVAGAISDIIAEKVTKVCSAMTTSLRQKHAEDELFQAKEILEQLEETERRIDQKIAMARARGIDVDELDG